MTSKQAYDKTLSLGKRIPKLEPTIIKNAQYSYYYALYVIKGKWELAEPTISKNAYYSYHYAKHIIKGKWELGEPIISKDAFYSYFYAKDAIKGKLPDFMHNALLLSNNKYAKYYVEFVNNIHTKE